MLQQLYKIEEKLQMRMNEKEKKLLEQFSDMQAEANALLVLDKFIDGYRWGASMMIEVFAQERDFVCDE